MTSPQIEAQQALQEPSSIVKSEKARENIRLTAQRDLFYLSKGILGYSALNKATHGPLCGFYVSCKATRRAFFYPRTHFKSTIITISGSIQDILNSPIITILLGGATDANAQRFLGEIKQHFMRNELLRWLFPELCWDNERQAPRWNQKEMEVPRSGFIREPTIDTVGTGAEVISRHYLRIRLDDFIGEKEYQSQSEMETAKDWLGGIESLLVPPWDERLIDNVGTRWKLDDGHARFVEMFGGGRHIQSVPIGPYAVQKGRRLAVLSRPVRENGQPIFPEKFNNRQLSEMQRIDPLRFAAQMMNDPLAAGQSSFELSWFKNYHYVGKNKVQLEDVEKPIRLDKCPTFILCDPSLGETKRSDKTAIPVVHVHLDEYPRLIISEFFLQRIHPNEIIERLFAAHKKYPWTRVMSIESVAFQKVLKYWMEQQVIEKRIPMPPIFEFKPQGGRISQQSKVERILGLQPIARAGQIYVPEEGFPDFFDEVQAWHPEAKQDDGLDALSQILEHIDFGWSQEGEDQIKEFNKLMAEARDINTGSWSENDPKNTRPGLHIIH